MTGLLACARHAVLGLACKHWRPSKDAISELELSDALLRWGVGVRTLRDTIVRTSYWRVQRLDLTFPHGMPYSPDQPSDALLRSETGVRTSRDTIPRTSY